VRYEIIAEIKNVLKLTFVLCTVMNSLCCSRRHLVLF
jgi:hypothetical protein